MDVILLLAATAFLASTIWSAITKAWPLALLAAGLLLIAISMAGILQS